MSKTPTIFDHITENIKNKNLIYPNPFNDKIYFENTQNLKLILIDDLGKVIYQGKDISEKDFSYLPKGIYSLLIEKPNKIESYRLIKK